MLTITIEAKAETERKTAVMKNPLPAWRMTLEMEKVYKA